jgi:HD-like signal output (HDOD) protein
MTAGLLHDIGMVLMQQHFTLKYVDFLKESCLEKRSPFDAESELFGVTHQAIGGYLLEWWGIPYPIVDSCLNHHDPLASSINRKLVCAVHLADYYAWNYLGRSDLVKLDERVFEEMGLNQERCENLVNEALHSWESESSFSF